MAAPSGGGGGGGPVGFANSFTGAAQALEIYGDFAAAYSGTQASSGTAYNLLDFTTGNYLFVGELTCYYAAQGSGSDMQFKVKLNGTTIGQFNLTDSNDLTEFPVPFLIPAYTQFEVEQDNLAGGTEGIAVSLIGRIYR